MRQTEIAFVYGALRSGTTVFRLMLDHHPMIANPGELDFLFDYLHRDPSHPTGWRYDIEAMKLDRIFHFRHLDFPKDAQGQPLDGLDLLESFLGQLENRYGGKSVMTINIHRHIDRILAIFPKARVIHMLRDPRDVARSSIGMGWAANIYWGVDHWIKTEQAWDRGVPVDLPKGQVFDLTYEALFRDIETVLKGVCSFLGVPWDTAMLSYHENSTYSPPDPTLVQQWKRKCSIDDLALLEGKAGALMRDKGYEPSAEGRQPSATEKVKLRFEQKLFVWRHSMKMFGPKLYWTEKLARFTGMRTWHSRIKHELNAIAQSQVK